MAPDSPMKRQLIAVLILSVSVAGCASATYISPNNPEYARTGAPRVGEPPVDPHNPYGRIMGRDSSGSDR